MEDIPESAQQLLPSLYNKDKEGEWKMDVNAEPFEAYDSDNDGFDGSDNKSSSDYNVMSEEEDDSDNSDEVLSDVSESDDGNSRSSYE